MSWNPIGQALSALNKVAGNELLQKLGLHGPATKIAYHATREGFRAATAVQRQWKTVAQLGRAERMPGPKPRELFDLSLTEEQTMIRDMTQRFAREVLRPEAAQADANRAAPADLAGKFAELGLAQFAVPEALGGAAAETRALGLGRAAGDVLGAVREQRTAGRDVRGRRSAAGVRCARAADTRSEDRARLCAERRENPGAAR
jgi:hypothetical protein